MRIVGSIEELKNLVGEEIGVSDWIEITQERINNLLRRQVIINGFILIRNAPKLSFPV